MATSTWLMASAVRIWIRPGSASHDPGPYHPVKPGMGEYLEWSDIRIMPRGPVISTSAIMSG
ncbi:hypothetical protein F4212_14035 [Candidatus Poribacteria bacterium]|nr:hypothetical protein [Candidatus Poribacteria bacterium]